MYEFTDTNALPEANFPSVAMLFDGSYLEDEIEGYQTLSVSGRELIADVLEVAEGRGKDGSVVISTSIPSRTLVIEYLLRADSNEDLRHKFNLLNRILRRDDRNEVVVAFTDEPDKHFYGHFEGAGEVPVDRNIVRGSFTIFCPFPYKFSDFVTFTGVTAGAKTSFTASDFTDYPAKPDYFYYIPATTISTFTIENETTGQTIILTGAPGDYVAGDEIVIAYPDDEITQFDGVDIWNIMADLDYVNTDLHNFRVKPGDIVSVTPAGAFSMILEGWFL